MHDAFQLLSAQMQTYFDGLYFGDVEKLRTVFHPEAHYTCAMEEPLKHINMETYFPIVANREAPAKHEEDRQDKIVSISFAGPNTALVIANCAIGEKYFTDHLSFIKTDGRWQIISKVFHFDLKPSFSERNEYAICEYPGDR